MFEKQKFSADETRLIGFALLVLSAAFLSGAISRFDWMKRHIPFMLRWGRAWSFPASRFGVIAGSVVGLTIGGICLDPRGELLPRKIWGIILAFTLTVALVAAVYDFRSWRRRR